MMRRAMWIYRFSWRAIRLYQYNYLRLTMTLSAGTTHYSQYMLHASSQQKQLTINHHFGFYNIISHNSRSDRCSSCNSQIREEFWHLFNLLTKPKLYREKKRDEMFAHLYFIFLKEQRQFNKDCCLCNLNLIDLSFHRGVVLFFIWQQRMKDVGDCHL